MMPRRRAFGESPASGQARAASVNLPSPRGSEATGRRSAELLTRLLLAHLPGQPGDRRPSNQEPGPALADETGTAAGQLVAARRS